MIWVLVVGGSWLPTQSRVWKAAIGVTRTLRGRPGKLDQDGILRSIQVHQDADRSYIEDGIQLLELASDAH